MNFVNIRNRRMAVLEQACERYAVMAFETMNGRLAIGVRSIRYSYDDHKYRDAWGIFHAEFVPWQVSDYPRLTNRMVMIDFDIEPQSDGKWKLLRGKATISGDLRTYTIDWSADGASMKISHEQEAIYSPGADQNQDYVEMVTV